MVQGMRTRGTRVATSRDGRLGSLRLRLLLAITAVALAIGAADSWLVAREVYGTYHAAGAEVALTVARSVEDEITARLDRPGDLQRELLAVRDLHPALRAVSLYAPQADGSVLRLDATGPVRPVEGEDWAALLARPVRYRQVSSDGYHSAELIHPLPSVDGAPPAALGLDYDLEELGPGPAATQRHVALLTLVCLLVGVVCVQVLLRVALFRPLGELRAVMRRLRDGDLDSRLGWRRAGEMGALATTFDEMAADLQRTHERLSALALEDSVTGLPNNRACQERLSAALRRAQREHHPLTVVVLDVDRFKLINDRYGHAVGDEALRVLGDALAGSIRPDDICGRLGGDEFIVVLADADAQAATEIVQRARVVLAGTPIGPGASLTISAGIAEYPLHSGDQAQLVVHADEALYRAKAQGRDRWVVYEAPQAGSDMVADLGAEPDKVLVPQRDAKVTQMWRGVKVS
jgi:diguanylate cyclase (GGDEF)-like protein